MRSLVSFLVLVLLAGCGSLEGCGSASAPAVVTGSAAPGAATAMKVSAPESPEADWERREADCQSQARAQVSVAARFGASGVPFLMDLRGNRSFVLLSHAPQDTLGAMLRQVGEDRMFWMAALQEDPTGAFKKGDTFDVYDRDGLVRAGCHVKGFASLNRGVPHFGYFQDPEPPKDPGCGSAWPVAELDCSLGDTRVGFPNAVAFALLGDHPVPRYLSLAKVLPRPLEASQEAALRALPAYAKTRAEGEAHAREQGLPLKESLKLRAFSAGRRKVVVAVARLYTGEGRSVCGGPDFSATVSRVVAVGEDGQATLVGGDVKGEDVLGVFDLEGDGRVELLTQDADDTWAAIVREDGSALTASFLPICDCGC